RTRESEAGENGSRDQRRPALQLHAAARGAGIGTRRADGARAGWRRAFRGAAGRRDHGWEDSGHAVARRDLRTDGRGRDRGGGSASRAIAFLWNRGRSGGEGKGESLGRAIVADQGSRGEAGAGEGTVEPRRPRALCVAT